MATVLGSNRNDFRWCQNLNEKSNYSWLCSLLAANPALLWETRVQDWSQGSCPVAPDAPGAAGCWALAPPWAGVPTRPDPPPESTGAVKISGRMWQNMCLVKHTGMCTSNRRTQKNLEIRSRLLSSPLLLFSLIFVCCSFTLMNTLFPYTEGMQSWQKYLSSRTA